jgi:hypothetical protein
MRRGVFISLLGMLFLSLAEAQPAPSRAQAYIRVVQDKGIWWFQDGAGHKFFSLGVNCIGGCYGHTEATPMLPSRQQWIGALLHGWGFNTAGCWSSPSVWPDFYVTEQIYAPFLPHAQDVFDAAFWQGPYADHLREEVRPFRGKTNVIGYFLDNEPAWNAQRIFAFYLRLGKRTPGSRAFLAYLKTYYQGQITTLNHDWGTSYRSFAQIPGTRPPQRSSRRMQHGIVQAWRTQVVATYYQRYATMVRALDPDHLILGIRYQGVPDRALFTALSPSFDVNSINDYNRYGHLRPVYATLYQATGKPLMITEFAFSGFPSPGQPSALFVEMYAQAKRGIGYDKYVRQAARAPFMVGMHWFKWSDYAQEASPESDPSPPDVNVGLVTADETAVYEDLGRWITQTNAAVEATHQVGREEPPPEPQPQRRPLPRFLPMVDGDVSEWPQALALTPTVVTALEDAVRADQTYFLSWDGQDIYLAGKIATPHQAQPSLEQAWAWERDYLAIQLRPVQPRQPDGDATPVLFIYPRADGPDPRQPSAARWTRSDGYRPIPLRVVQRRSPSGFTMEARIPGTALWGFTGRPGASWRITLRYQNAMGISQTAWQGIVTLRR